MLGTVTIFTLKTRSTKIDARTRTLMRNSVAYTLRGKRTNNKYQAFTKVKLIDRPVIINKQPYYWLGTKKQRLIMASNIDGVKRKVKHNAYVYATSSRKAALGLVRKGKTIITYGSSLCLKNGKRYYRIGGPAKQIY
ncbi:SLAP domain-containing protein [Lactobacillus panisapium]|uniref:SLAP domain-containing protein n=1 Tax=Lactobacillus panisapium TaxID=2012495 RepID=UPI003B845FDD